MPGGIGSGQHMRADHPTSSHNPPPDHARHPCRPRPPPATHVSKRPRSFSRRMRLLEAWSSVTASSSAMRVSRSTRRTSRTLTDPCRTKCGACGVCVGQRVVRRAGGGGARGTAVQRGGAPPAARGPSPGEKEQAACTGRKLAGTPTLPRKLRQRSSTPGAQMFRHRPSNLTSFVGMTAAFCCFLGLRSAMAAALRALKSSSRVCP